MSNLGGVGGVRPFFTVGGDADDGTPPAAPGAGLRSGLLAGDRTLAAVAAGTGEVALGARGPHVRLVQEALCRLGYLPRGDWTVFGRDTEAAVAAFQRRQGLTPDGRVGPQTLARLDAAMPRAGDLAEWKAQLSSIMPQASQEDLDAYAGPLQDAMEEFDIDTPLRKRAFIAQLAHESGELRWHEELASGADYEGRADLGNTRPGDGVRYKGRGLIQVTGRDNYKRIGAAIGEPLETNPTRLLDPVVSARAAAYFWKSRGLNELADANRFTDISRAINGGLNGIDDRREFWARAKLAIR